MNTVVTLLPTKAAAPGSATLFAAPRQWLARTGAALLNAFVESGRVRAEWHLREMADRFQSVQPELAKELRLAASRQQTGS